MIATISKKYRLAKGISQEELAGSLGMSRNTVISIENGKRELTLSEAERFSRILGVSVEALISEQLPNFSKYKEMILYTLSQVNGDGKIPKTKLAKIIYLADFAWFYYKMESMSGMSYRKIMFGPVPDAYFRAIDELEQGGLISLEIKNYPSGHTQLLSLTKAGKMAGTDNVSGEEKNLIKKISKNWENKNTQEIVGFTHQQLPYLLALDGEIISYALIGQEEEKNLF